MTREEKVSLGKKILTGVMATSIMFTGLASSVSAQEVQANNTQAQKTQEVVPYNVLNLDKTGTLKGKSLDVWNKPDGLAKSSVVKDSGKYLNKDYSVVKQEDVQGQTWYKLKQGKKDIGWVKAENIDVRDYVKKENVKEHENVGKIKDSKKDNLHIYKEPRYTKGAYYVADFKEYKNKPLQITEKATTKVKDEKVTWYKFKHNGKDVGWIKEDDIDVGKHDIAYVYRKGDTLKAIEDTFGKSKKELQKLNSNIDFNNLKDGQQIKLIVGKPLQEPKSVGLNATGKAGKFVKATPTQSTQAFINQILPAVEDIKEQGVLPSVAIAQAIIESRSGNSGLAQNGNNLFGIKGTYNGNGVTYQTKEFYSGNYVTTRATFRAYPSWNESIVDYARFLNQNQRYHRVIGEKDYRKFTQGLKDAGYATSPTYAQTLNSVIEGYGLYKLDK